MIRASRHAHESACHEHELRFDMRTIMAVALGSVVSVSGVSAQLNSLDRQHLLAHMEMTEKSLVDEVSRLSPAQLAFRPSPNAWTILDVLDHLVVVGPIYWKDLRNAQPATGDRVGRMSDADVLWYGIDRTNRETALRTEEPTRRLKDVTSGLAAYRKQHAQLQDYIRTTQDDLR